MLILSTVGVGAENDTADEIQEKTVDELDEGLGLRDEVGLAVDLGERHGLLVGGLGQRDDALLGLLVDALGGDGETLLAEILDGLIHVAVARRESFLARTHAGGGRLTELLNHVNRNSHSKYEV